MAIESELQRAEELFNRGALKEARTVLYLLRARAPDNVEVLFMLADTLCELREFSDAQIEYEAVLRIDPAHCEARLALAEINYAAGDFVHAAYELHEGLKRCPNSARVLHLLGLTYDVLEKHREAENFLRAAIAADSSNREYKMDLGRHLERMTSDLQRAAEVYAELLAGDLRDLGARKLLGGVMVRLGRPKEALGILHPVQDVADADVHAARARAHEMTADFDQAVDAWHDAVRIEPDSAQLHLWLAEAAWEDCDPDLAKQEALEAITLDEDLARAYLLLARIHFGEGNDRRTVENVYRALELDIDLVQTAPRELIDRFLSLAADAEDWRPILTAKWEYQ